MNTNCVGCKYYRPLQAGSKYGNACHYLIETGKQRNSDPENCDKKVLVKRAKK